MQTRSQTNYETTTVYEVNIDFDEASKIWRENKLIIGCGMYRYVCAKRGIRNNMCISKCLPGEIYCKTHLQMFKEGKF
jgi:hypothetical protein